MCLAGKADELIILTPSNMLVNSETDLHRQLDMLAH